MAYPMVRIEWQDAYGDAEPGSWTKISKVLRKNSDNRTIVTVGQLICDNEHGCMVALNYDKDVECIDGWIFIPKSQVRKMKEVK